MGKNTKSQAPPALGLAFSEISYLPRQSDEPQKFLYATRIAGGMRIEGAGESVGAHESATGQRTSALKFWSEDRKSLIETGSGYWKYVPNKEAIHFITSYDYRTRFGVLGNFVDKVSFRPLLGWATAWSFDRLRLWIEQDITPEGSRDRFLAYSLARLTLAFVWLYHGVIPKLLYRDPDELKMLREAGISSNHLITTIWLFGLAEVGLAVFLLVLWKASWPLWSTIAAMILATLAVSITSPRYLTAAFNPLTLNLSIATLAVVALWLRRAVPSAGNCLRKPQVN